MAENNYDELTREIQEIVFKLLDEGKVEKVIAYGKGEYSDETTPVFIKNAEDSSKLIFNSKCSMMLAKYLLNYSDQKIGIVAKPCDTRVISSYLSDKLLKRENLVIIGINGCRGIDGNTACLECDVRNPIISDYTVGEPIKEDELTEIIGNAEIKLEKMNSQERFAYFQNEFSRCTRCYACREACPVCYCDECFVESNQPFWVSNSVTLRDNFTFHLMRSMHMAGRCVNCGACEMACPEGIDVRALTSKLYRVGEEIFKYKSGMDPEQKTLLAEYDFNDSQEGFLE